jgi:hypothetical protein
MHAWQCPKEALGEFHGEYKLIGKTSYQGITEKVNEYSYREIAHRLAEVINAVA